MVRRLLAVLAALLVAAPAVANNRCNVLDGFNVDPVCHRSGGASQLPAPIACGAPPCLPGLTDANTQMEIVFATDLRPDAGVSPTIGPASNSYETGGGTAIPALSAGVGPYRYAMGPTAEMRPQWSTTTVPSHGPQTICEVVQSGDNSTSHNFDQLNGGTGIELISNSGNPLFILFGTGGSSAQDSTYKINADGGLVALCGGITSDGGLYVTSGYPGLLRQGVVGAAPSGWSTPTSPTFYVANDYPDLYDEFWASTTPISVLSAAKAINGVFGLPENILLLGDSTTYGWLPLPDAGASQNQPNYPSLIQTQLGPAFNVINGGDPGATVLSVATYWGSNYEHGGNFTVVNWMMVNDELTSTATATTQANYIALINRELADGAQVILATTGPAGCYAGWTAAMQAAWVANNSWLTTYGATNGYQVVDLATILRDPGVYASDAGTCLNAPWSIDGIHMNSAGDRVIANAVGALAYCKGMCPDGGW